MLKTLVLSTLLASGVAGIAQAQALKPLQASAIDLGATHGTAYYVSDANGFQVVATLDTSTTPIRFGTTLARGQSASVSVPAGVGESAIEITFVRVGDSLEVRRSIPFDAVTAATR